MAARNRCATTPLAAGQSSLNKKNVVICNRQRATAVCSKNLKLRFMAAIHSLKISEADISLAIVNDKEIAQLHELWLGIPGPTDVLSFDLSCPERSQHMLHKHCDSVHGEIIASEVFKVGGVFDPDQFQNVIRSAGYTPLLYRDEMRTDSLFGQMLAGIRQSAFVTEAESKRYSSLLSQTRDLAYLQIRVDEIIDEVSVSDEEIEFCKERFFSFYPEW